MNRVNVSKAPLLELTLCKLSSSNAGLSIWSADLNGLPVCTVSKVHVCVAD